LFLSLVFAIFFRSLVQEHQRWDYTGQHHNGDYHTGAHHHRPVLHCVWEVPEEAGVLYQCLRGLNSSPSFPEYRRMGLPFFSSCFCSSLQRWHCKAKCQHGMRQCWRWRFSWPTKITQSGCSQPRGSSFFPTTQNPRQTRTQIGKQWNFCCLNVLRHLCWFFATVAVFLKCQEAWLYCLPTVHSGCRLALDICPAN